MTAPHTNNGACAHSDKDAEIRLLTTEVNRLRKLSEFQVEAKRTIYLNGLKRVGVLTEEIGRLQFINKEKHETINELSGYITLLTLRLEQADKYLPDNLQHAELIKEAREAIQ